MDKTIISERLPFGHVQRQALEREANELNYDRLKKEIGERFKTAFETESYSEIARMLDIPSVTNAKMYVDGLRFPSAEVLARFRARGYSLEWLFTGNGSKWAKPERLFSEDDEKRIRVLAEENGLSFWEQVEKLTRAGLGFLDELEG